MSQGNCIASKGFGLILLLRSVWEQSADTLCFANYDLHAAGLRHACEDILMKNLLNNIPGNLAEELFNSLVKTDNIHIQRIVSKGHTSPEQGWYDQKQNEWVLVLKGAARLEFEDGSKVSMGAGDCLEIDAHQKHRVVWTDEEEETVWVAVHHR